MISLFFQIFPQLMPGTRLTMERVKEKMDSENNKITFQRHQRVRKEQNISIIFSKRVRGMIINQGKIKNK
jgi:hypothetical protein